MKLSPEEVLKIARLARLRLHAADVEKFSSQLSSILTYVEKLNQLDTSKIEATAHAVEIPTPFRADITARYTDQELSLNNAPARDGNFFKVPKVI